MGLMLVVQKAVELVDVRVVELAEKRGDLLAAKTAVMKA